MGVVCAHMPFFHRPGHILCRCMSNEKMERARGIANLIQELRGIQNYTFGVSFNLESANIEIL